MDTSRQCYRREVGGVVDVEEGRKRGRGKRRGSKQRGCCLWLRGKERESNLRFPPTTIFAT
jgi:hypothetical protein